jgi:hypothetical protein
VKRVSDEVWQRLDPDAGRMSRRELARLWLVIGAAVVVLIGGSTVWRTGLVVPRLVWTGGTQASYHTVDRVARVGVDLLNAGRFPVTVGSVGRSDPGLQFLGTATGPNADDPMTRPFPVTLEPDNGIVLWLVYRVTDCASLSTASWPVTAIVERPWGSMTVDLDRDGSWPEPWQRQIAHFACEPG